MQNNVTDELKRKYKLTDEQARGILAIYMLDQEIRRIGELPTEGAQQEQPQQTGGKPRPAPAPRSEAEGPPARKIAPLWYISNAWQILEPTIAWPLGIYNMAKMAMAANAGISIKGALPKRFGGMNAVELWRANRSPRLARKFQNFYKLGGKRTGQLRPPGTGRIIERSTGQLGAQRGFASKFAKPPKPPKPPRIRAKLPSSKVTLSRGFIRPTRPLTTRSASEILKSFKKGPRKLGGKLGGGLGGTGVNILALQGVTSLFENIGRIFGVVPPKPNIFTGKCPKGYENKNGQCVPLLYEEFL